MDAKKYLGQLSSINFKISCKLEQLGILRSMIGTQSPSLKSDNVMSSPNQDKLESMVIKICDLEKDINNLIDSKFEIINNIEKIEDSRQYKIVYFKYVNDMTIYEICDELKIKKRTAYSDLERGTENIQRIIDGIA